jgi:hypothetical protein
MREKRQKPVPTRRRTALDRLALLALVLAAYILLGGYGLTPRTAIYSAEESANTGKTQVVQSLGTVPIPKTGSRGYLCANDNALMVVLARFDWRTGWLCYNYDTLDCAQSAPLHVTTYTLSMWSGGESQGQVCCLYGRIDDRAAARLLVRVGYFSDPEGKNWVEVEDLELDRSDWVQSQGSTYFIRQLSDDRVPYDGKKLQVRAELLDSQGNSLYRTDRGEDATDSA